MSERCEPPQPPATDGARGSDRLSLKTVAFALLVVLLFYTWFWVLTAGVLCGCGLALCVARSRRLRACGVALKLYLVDIAADEQAVGGNERGCTACGAYDCTRHDPRPALEPWVGLRVHKQLDSAIEDFYNAILETFVSGWHSGITRQQSFLDELRHQLRYASASLLRRAYKINYSKFIVDKLTPCALHHHGIWLAAQKNRLRSPDLRTSSQNRRRCRSTASDPLRPDLTVPRGSYVARNGSDTAPKDDSSVAKHRRCSFEPSSVELSALEGPLRGSLHPAVASRAEELKYLRCVTEAIMPYLLWKEEVDNKVFRVLIREIFAGWVLLSLTDVLADPYILNTLVVLATGDETMSVLPKNPSYQVEFLESFARPSDSRHRRAAMLKVDLDTLLSSPEYLYALMQHMRSVGHLHLLQFVKDMKPFQMKILNPELTKNEEVSLFNEAWDLYVQYFDPDSPSAISFAPAVVEEMRAVLSEGPANVRKLQTSKALYQSSKYADGLLENIYIPKFLHSEEFYKLFFGPRTPGGYNKRMTKKPQEKLYTTALRLGNRLKGALRTSTIDGQILDCFANSIDIAEAGGSDSDSADNVSVLRYLDSLAEQGRLNAHDLSGWRVDFTSADIRQLEPKRNTPPAISRVFTVSVQRPPSSSLVGSMPECTSWSVERSEHDMHLLRAKLVEFHGDALFQELTLPSRRDNSPLEILRYKYEDFVQRLLRQRLLTSSQLLHIFLTAEADFSLAVQRASLAAGGSDLSNIYQSVAHRLRKEKGQHLEPFMSTFLLSCDMERYRAMKQGTSAAVEEGEEVDEAALDVRTHSSERVRDIRNETFGDNFRVEREEKVLRLEQAYQTRLTGFTKCLMYLLTKVLHARALVCTAFGCAGSLLRNPIDRTFSSALNATLRRVLTQQRLGHLVRLGHELLFIHKQPGRQHTDKEQHERARSQLQARIPNTLALLLGADVRPNMDNILGMLQHPRLNKQLVYKLLDLCIAELFPELLEDSSGAETR